MSPTAVPQPVVSRYRPELIAEFGLPEREPTRAPRIRVGTPFVYASGNDPFEGCRQLNRFLLEAARLGVAKRRGEASAGEVRRRYANPLRRLLGFLWSAAGRRIELGEALEEQLLDYRDLRLQRVSPATWNNEQGLLRLFYDSLVEWGAIGRSPFPTFGGRSAMKAIENRSLEREFLFDDELGAFLGALSGGGFCEYCNEYVGFPTIERKSADYTVRRMPIAFPHREYAIARVIVSTGLRHTEVLDLLDSDLPSLEQPTAESIDVRQLSPNRLPYSWLLRGKTGKERVVHVMAPALTAVDVYRRTERRQLVQAAQPLLRRELRDAQRIPVRRDGDELQFVGTGERMRAHRIPADVRRRLVAVSHEQANGGVRVEPAALFITRRGKPFAGHQHLWELFDSINEHFSTSDHDCRPRIRVTPHTLRHTMAVRMLYALIYEATNQVDRAFDAIDLEAVSGSALIQVAEWLGHNDPETTRTRYLRGVAAYVRWRESRNG